MKYLSAVAVGLLCIVAVLGHSEKRPAQAATVQANVKMFSLPGSDGLVMLDYLAFDPADSKIWVPAGNTARVDAIDVNTGEISSIPGFATRSVTVRGRRRSLGPSSVSVGDGVVYIGNRGDSSICAVDAVAIKRGDCITMPSKAGGLASAPDGLAYVAATKELWATVGAPPLGIGAPDKSLVVFDASTPRRLTFKLKVPLDGSGEGYAVDRKRERFYTNVEERGTTVAVDVHKHTVVATWRSGCQEPHGLALDQERGFLFVACNSRVISLDLNHDGRVVNSVATGDGVDNIDYSPKRKFVYAAAQDAATLTVARVEDDGRLTREAVIPTAKSTRVVVVDNVGRAYVADPLHGRIIRITVP